MSDGPLREATLGHMAMAYIELENAAFVYLTRYEQRTYVKPYQFQL
jgi:hypothetical protein